MLYIRNYVGEYKLLNKIGVEKINIETPSACDELEENLKNQNVNNLKVI